MSTIATSGPRSRPPRERGAVHELSLASAVIDTVERHAAGRRVTARVPARWATCARSCPTSLEFYFEHVARGTVCEGARLEQELVPARLRCDCGARMGARRDRLPLLGLRRRRREVVSGDEFLVESIEVEEQEPACTA